MFPPLEHDIRGESKQKSMNFKLNENAKVLEYNRPDGKLQSPVMDLRYILKSSNSRLTDRHNVGKSDERTDK